jgi:hypothetical protein
MASRSLLPRSFARVDDITHRIVVLRGRKRLRDLFVSNRTFAQKFDELERKVGRHDEAIVGILRALRELMTPQSSTRRGIGFTADLK